MERIEMEQIEIKGKVVFQDIGMGFWGIVDGDNQWRPVNMPEELKKEGLEVKLSAEQVCEDVSIFMWGKPVRINSREGGYPGGMNETT